jgi:transcriptional regulator with XRE-family HTH domain
MHMPSAEIDLELLQKLIRSRRKSDDLSLRDAAEQIGISAPTLQRVEAGQPPNTASLIRITEWLKLAIDDVLQKSKELQPGPGTLAQIEVHLRADPRLDSDAAEAIAEAVQKLYAAYSKQPRRK